MGDTRIQDTDGSFRSAIVGFSLLYAVAVVYYYSTWLIPFEGPTSTGYANALNIAMVLCAVAVALLVRFVHRAARITAFTAGTVLFAAAVLTQLFMTSSLTTVPVLSEIIGAGAGIGIGLLMPLWFEAIASFPGKRRAYACGIMSFCGMAVGMAVEYLPHPVLECVCLAMIVVSTILYSRQVFGILRGKETSGDVEVDVGNEPEGNAAAPGNATPHASEKTLRTAVESTQTAGIGSLMGVFLVPMACALSMSIVYGMIDATVMHATVTPDMALFISQFGGLAAGAIFLLYIRIAKSPAGTALINGIFGVVATGLLLLPFLPETYGIALNLIAATGWKLALLILFIFVVEYFAEQPRKLLPWITAAYALPRFGLLIGSNLPLLFPVEEGYTFVRLAAVAFFLLYLILMTVWLINARARKAAERKAEELSQYREDPKRAIRIKAGRLAETRGLTKRETEVMMLLAEGRDLSYICNECYLSRNTVKSYTKSIYLKLDVHSKQELIDLVDNA